MNENYLWDRTGEPDQELAHLEEVLGKLRWTAPGPDSESKPAARQSRPTWKWLSAAAALLALGLGATAFFWTRHSTAAGTSWQLTMSGQKPAQVRTGQLIETAHTAGAIMESEFVGRVDIEPGSRLHMLEARDDRQRLALDHGTIHALIWAPPTRFVVDTLAAKTVDLGCQYTLRVAPDGTGFLTVQMGWVAFQWHQIESFIPAGAACATRPEHGPATPYFLDAPEELTRALPNFDRTNSEIALREALTAARPRDAFSLWHLLQRTQGPQRAEVFDRFAELVKLPAAVTRESILRGDRASIDSSWDALQLGDTAKWREWKRQW